MNKTIMIGSVVLMLLGFFLVDVQSASGAENAAAKYKYITTPKFDIKSAPNLGDYYPRESARNDEEGNIYFAVLVNEEGVPKDIYMVVSSGFKRLDDAASTYMLKLRYLPGTINGEKAAMWYFPKITFRTGGKKSKYEPTPEQKAAAENLLARSQAYYSDLDEKSFEFLNKKSTDSDAGNAAQ